MEVLSNKILNIFNQIKGGGSYVSKGSSAMVVPGLNIEGIGEISLPINTEQIKEIIKQAHKAAFGKGSKTIIDTKVRSVWEIDANKISFLNPNWEKTVKKIIVNVKEGLGIEEQTISTSLYKLLVYEEGDFFVAHKDSEKESGMFGTLVVVLPSKHTGGELHVRFDGKEEIIDFVETINNYEIPFVAFYADCEHEIKKIISGYRVALVYNLLQQKSNEVLKLDEAKVYIDSLAKVLEKNENRKPLVILLEHQYTPENFSLQSLKHNDKHKTEVMLKAAEQAGYYAKLGLLTCYQMGEIEGDFYYDRDGGDGDGEMGEVYDENTKIEHWAEDGLPSLGEFEIDEEELIKNYTIKDGDPINKEEEGYTGNAGMTIEYWYHYGAIVLWKKEQHAEIISTLQTDTKLDWLNFYKTKKCDAKEIELIKNMLADIANNSISDYRTDKLDFNIVAEILIKLDDKKFVQSESCKELLFKIFSKISSENWVKLSEQYHTVSFEETFLKATKKLKYVAHLSSILLQLSIEQQKKYEKYVALKLETILSGIANLGITEKENITVSCLLVSNLLKLSKYKNDDAVWLKETVEKLTNLLPRYFTNRVLAAALLQSKGTNKEHLHKEILKICIKDLETRINNKPKAPETFTREVPNSNTDKKVWEIITPFLLSETEKDYNYKANQSLRDEMESVLKKAKVDITTETIKKGQPHTLKIIKTQASFKRLLNKWEEDVELLDRLKRVIV
jgi:hypothetical protein